MNEMIKQHLFSLLNQCYSLLQEQINKRITFITIWGTINTLIYGALFTSERAMEHSNVLLSISFVLGVLFCYALIGMISWQNTYKKSCVLLGQILMNSDLFKELDDINEYIEKNFGKKEKTQILKSTTNTIMIICLVISLIPVFLMCIFNLHNGLIIIIGAIVITIIHIIVFCILLKKSKTRVSVVPWLLRFDA